MNVFLINAEWMFTGVVVWLGFLFVFFKLPSNLKRWLVQHSLITDLLVTGVMFMLHWGILTAIFTTMAKPFYRGTSNGRL